jgi:hypothetical protein
MRTGDSRIRQALAKTPLGFLDSDTAALLKSGSVADKQTAVARMALGSSVAGLVAYYAHQGIFTGVGPSDPKVRTSLEATGWKPESIKMGDHYVSLEPILGSVGTAVNAVTSAVERLKEAGDDAGYAKDAVKLADGFTTGLLHNGWLSSIADLFSLAEGSDGQRGQAMNRLLADKASSLTVPAVVRSANNNYFDGKMRDTTGDGSTKDVVLGKMASGVPGVSTMLPAKHDTMGREIDQDVAPGETGALNPVKSRTDTDPADLEIRALQEKYPTKPLMTQPNSTIKIKGVEGKIKLDAEDYEKVKTYSGAYFNTTFGQLRDTDGWKTLGDSDKAEILHQLSLDAHKFARDQYASDLFSKAGMDAKGQPLADPKAKPTVATEGPVEAAPSKGDKPVAAGDQFPGVVQSIRRTVHGNEIVGGKPNSDHLRGDAVDFTPPAGMSMSQLEAEAHKFFPGHFILNEGSHVHVKIPGLNGPLFGKRGTAQ